MFLAFKNGLKSIQTADYNGARTIVMHIRNRDYEAMHVKLDELYLCFKPV